MGKLIVACNKTTFHPKMDLKVKVHLQYFQKILQYTFLIESFLFIDRCCVSIKKMLLLLLLLFLLSGHNSTLAKKSLSSSLLLLHFFLAPITITTDDDDDLLLLLLLHFDPLSKHGTLGAAKCVTV